MIVADEMLEILDDITVPEPTSVLVAVGIGLALGVAAGLAALVAMEAATRWVERAVTDAIRAWGGTS